MAPVIRGQAAHHGAYSVHTGFEYDASDATVAIDTFSPSEVSGQTRVAGSIYNSQGLVLMTFDPAPVNSPGDSLVLNFYDESGRISQSRDIDDAVTSYTYDHVTGLVAEIKNPVQTENNAAGIRFAYDSAGNRLALMDENAHETRWTWDPLNRPLTERKQAAFRFNESTVTAVEHLVDRHWTYGGPSTIQHDFRPLAAIDADGDGLNDQGRKIGYYTSPAVPQQIESWYADQESVADVADGSAVPVTTIVHDFNSAGDLTSAATFDGAREIGETPLSVVTTTYDEFGRPDLSTTDFVTPDVPFRSPLTSPTFTLDRSFDPVTGLLHSADSAFAGTTVTTTTWHVDALHRIYGIEQDHKSGARSWWGGIGTDSNPGSVGADKSVWIEYNANGTRTAVTRFSGLSFVPGPAVTGRTEYAYHPDGQLQKLTHRQDIAGERIADHTFAFNDRNLLEQHTQEYFSRLGTRLDQLNSGERLSTDTHFLYDGFGQILKTGQQDAANSSSAIDWSQIPAIQYDSAGNRMESSSTETGAANRRVKELYFLYEYDAAGNRTKQTDSSEKIYDNADATPGIEYHGDTWPGVIPGRIGGNQRYTETPDAHVVIPVPEINPGQQITPGTYDLWATWQEDPSEGGSGRFVVEGFDLPVPFELAQDVDFTVAPSKTHADGIAWELLGTVTITAQQNPLIALKLFNTSTGLTPGGALPRAFFDAVKITANAAVQEFSWDHRNRLTSIKQFNVALDEVGTIVHQYDAFDRRIATIVETKHPENGNPPSVTTTGRYFDDRGVAYEVKLSGTAASTDAKIVQATFNGLMANEVLAVDVSPEDSPNVTAWAFADRQGTVTSWGIEQSGEYHVAHTGYTPTGELIGGIASESTAAAGIFAGVETQLPSIWAGHRVEPDAGLLDAKARWIDTNSGVFLSEDPLSYAAGDANLYRYAFNSPGNLVDPDGRAVETVWDVASIGVGIGSVVLDVKQIWNTGEGWSDLGLDLLGLAVDGVAAALPFVPGGVSIARQTGRAITKADVGYTALRGLKAADAVGNAYQGYQAASRGATAFAEGNNAGFIFNGLQASLAFVGVGARGMQGLAALGYHYDFVHAAAMGVPLARLANIPVGGTRNNPIELTEDLLQSARAQLRFGNRVVLGRNSVYNIGSQIFETDDLGRLARTRVSVDAGSLRPAGQRIARWSDTSLKGYKGTPRLGRPNDVGSHLIADLFGGAKYYPNIVPGSGGLNSPGAFRKLERLWEKGINNGKTIDITIELAYGAGSKLRPRSFNITTAIQGYSPVFVELSNRADAFIDPRLFKRLQRLMG